MLVIVLKHSEAMDTLISRWLVNSWSALTIGCLSSLTLSLGPRLTVSMGIGGVGDGRMKTGSLPEIFLFSELRV